MWKLQRVYGQIFSNITGELKVKCRKPAAQKSVHKTKACSGLCSGRFLVAKYFLKETEASKSLLIALGRWHERVLQEFTNYSLSCKYFLEIHFQIETDGSGKSWDHWPAEQSVHQKCVAQRVDTGQDISQDGSDLLFTCPLPVNAKATNEIWRGLALSV